MQSVGDRATLKRRN